MAPWAAGATNNSAIVPAKEADNGIHQNVSSHQPAILKDWKQLQGLKCTSKFLFLKFADRSKPKYL